MDPQEARLLALINTAAERRQSLLTKMLGNPSERYRIALERLEADSADYYRRLRAIRAGAIEYPRPLSRKKRQSKIASRQEPRGRVSFFKRR